MKESIFKIGAAEWEAQARKIAAELIARADLSEEDAAVARLANSLIELAEVKSKLVPATMLDDIKDRFEDLVIDAEEEAEDTGGVQHAMARLEVLQREIPDEIYEEANTTWREACLELAGLKRD